MGVKAFKLITGEDVIADVIADFDNVLVAKNPAVVIMQRSEDGRIGVGLQPYVPFAKDGKLEFYKHALSATFEVETQMVNEYNRIFGNGIIIAGANEIPR